MLVVVAAVIVGNYVARLGRPWDRDLALAVELELPI
jgi:hypothetical protein